MKISCCIISCLFVFIFITNTTGKASAQHFSEVNILNLRCQYLKDPVGIDEQHPAFSWKISSDQKNVMQTAYQIVVASSLDKLNEPDLWNSGRISSDQNTFIRYRGRPDLPFKNISSGSVHAFAEKTPYTVSVSKGTFMQKKGTVFRLVPEKNKIVLNLAGDNPGIN